MFRWITTPYGLAGGYRRFGEISCFQVYSYPAARGSMFLETSVITYQTARYYNREDENLNFLRIEHLKYNKFIYLSVVLFQLHNNGRNKFIKWLDFKQPMTISDLDGKQKMISKQLNKGDILI